MIIPNDILFPHIREEIRAGHSVRIQTRGNSMLPLIRPGTDEIELSPLDKRSLQKGNIVLARSEDGRYLVHRIEKVKAEVVFLRGDGNASARETCTVNNFFAQLTGIFRKGKKIEKNSFQWKFAQYGWPSSPLLRRICLGVFRRLHCLHQRIKSN
ncbi:MAG TPA: S24/S26 family peptidase [Bacteroidales bacterium]|jgi:hypothetical protein|nr:S24/S26 family peptidase [Burkholderiales bacterium]NLZ09614.1 hypothetical protein [Bacteroidales bacterium]HNR27758.1 S24/S26 family peptidase [Bacteroidales bacterium]HNT48847.1 S24/S26 family peptidase [Bacteroidales bacterium]HNW22660.1 S24/S26 family peptidase [Bacteroidales bacterium]